VAQRQEQESLANREEQGRYWRTLEQIRTDLSRSQRRLDIAEDRRTDMFVAADGIMAAIDKIRAFRASPTEDEKAEESTARKIFGSDRAQQSTLQALSDAQEHIRRAIHEEYQREAIRERLRTAIALCEYNVVVMGRFLEVQSDRLEQSEREV
jgi:hypothetical protein